MKKLILTTLTIFLISVVTLSSAQSLDDILDKHYKAMGYDKLEKVETVSMKIIVNQMGMELPMEMKIKKPGKFRVDMDMQGQKMVQAFDGENGWTIMPWVSSEIQDLAGEELKQAQTQANLEGELYKFKEKGSTADLIGKVKEGDKEAYRIKLTKEDDNVNNYFIDANTYLVFKVKSKVNTMGQTVEVEQRMMEYKDYDGIMMPTKMESETPMGTATITMDEVKLNTEIEDSIFKRPAK